MYPKMLTVLQLTKDYSRYAGDIQRNELLDWLLEEHRNLTCDQKWFSGIEKSFRSAIFKNESILTWKKEQLKNLGTFIASDDFQDYGIENSNCMSFVYHLLNNKYDSYYCEYHYSFPDRGNRFITENHLSLIAKDKLTIGDFIFYRNQNDELMHIGLFLGKFNGKDYVLSKIGKGHEVLMHPMQDVPEVYGKPEFYKNSMRLSAATNRKLQEAKVKLSVDLNDHNIAASSIGLWSTRCATSSNSLERISANKTGHQLL